ncbi:MAG: DUF1761 domain-containing protein [Bacteroidetes bacterium]|nr:DUF1761 domain-containing protein [Bacteroidota bacterium]
MDVNFLSIAVAAVSCFAVGFIWYHPKTFGPVWMHSIGMTEEKAKQGNMPLIFGVSFVVALLLAFYLYLDVNFGGAPGMEHGTPDYQTFKHGAFHGLFLGILVALPVIFTNALYEQRNFKYMFINAGYWIVSMALMGGIVCAWP